MHIFFVHFVKYEFCVYLACIYFRECRLKDNFACIQFCEIDQNSRKNTHAKISTIKVKTLSGFQSDDIIKN